jgi:hypothetical protein
VTAGPRGLLRPAASAAGAHWDLSVRQQQLVPMGTHQVQGYHSPAPGCSGAGGGAAAGAAPLAAGSCWRAAPVGCTHCLLHQTPPLLLLLMLVVVLVWSVEGPWPLHLCRQLWEAARGPAQQLLRRFLPEATPPACHPHAGHLRRCCGCGRCGRCSGCCHQALLLLLLGPHRGPLAGAVADQSYGDSDDT